jgi:hypothetical protein
MRERADVEDDIALKDAQVIWSYHGKRADAPPVRVVAIMSNSDDRDYFASWGACNAEFSQADDAGRLLQLFVEFHQMTIQDGLDPKAIHDAFLVIPEYRAALHPSLLPAHYRDE